MDKIDLRERVKLLENELIGMNFLIEELKRVITELTEIKEG